MQYALMSKPGLEDTYGLRTGIFAIYDSTHIEYVTYNIDVWVSMINLIPHI